MNSTIRKLFLFKKKSSVILFMILQVVYSIQIDFNINRVSIRDCLNADKKDVELFLQKTDKSSKGVINHRAKYILSELFTPSGKNVTSSKIFDKFYSYYRHQHAVQHTIFAIAPQRSVPIMLITTDCQSRSRLQFDEILLKNYFVYCHSLNETSFFPLEIIESFNALRVKIAVLILPRLIIQTFLEIAAKLQAERFIYITVDYDAKMIRGIHEMNPLLEFHNLDIVNASDLTENEIIRRVNQTECSLSAGKIFHRDDYQIFVCRYLLPRILQIVTISFENDAFPLPNIYPFQNKCEIGLPCRRRSGARLSRDSRHEWDWICCSGRLIDKLIIILNDIKIPFSIYMVEDGRFGSYTNGTWNGLVNDLYTGKADVAVASMTITRERFKVMNYVFETSERTPIAFLLRRPDVDAEFMNFSFIPRDGKNLIAFLVLLHLTVFLFVYVFECIAFHQYHGQKYNFKDSWSFVGAIFFQRDLGGIATVGWGGRVLAITYACGMTILISTYTATLTAEKIDYEDIPEFKGFRDKMFQDSSTRIGIVRHGAHEDIVDKYNHKSQRIDVVDYETSAKQLFEKKIDAIIGAIWDLKRALVSETDYCKHLIIHSDEIETEDVSWGYQENSKFGNLVSLSIQRLIKTKSFNHIEEKWKAVSSCQQKILKQYPWQYAGGLIVCLLVTIGACVIILVSETIFLSFRRIKVRSYTVSEHE